MFAEFGEFLPTGGGLLYWVALVAVAGGLTLLLTALFVKWWHPIRTVSVPEGTGLTAYPRVAQVPGQEVLTSRTPGTEPAIPIMKLDRPDEPSGTAPTEIDRNPGTGPNSLEGLIDRLRRAADRLDGMAGDLAASPAGGGDSALKPLGEKVEYVFRASRH